MKFWITQKWLFRVQGRVTQKMTPKMTSLWESSKFESLLSHFPLRPERSCTRLRVPLSRYTCCARRVAADFLDFIAFCRCSTGVTLHHLKILVSRLPPPCAGRCRTEIWVWKGVALHGGVAATVAGVALHCATKVLKGHFWVAFESFLSHFESLLSHFWVIFELLLRFCDSWTCSPIGSSQIKTVTVISYAINEFSDNSTRCYNRNSSVILGVNQTVSAIRF